MHSQLFYPHYFMPHFVEGVRSHQVTEFHIMCNHMRFRGPEVRKVMPKDTFYFSIMRNPVSMMESLFTYYKSIPAFHGFGTLEDFLLDSGRSYNGTLRNNHYARNILSFDFGFNNSAVSSAAELDERGLAIIAAIESEFHLVLISEYFDESMVLLRHALCWTLEDILSFRLNSRSEKSRKSLSAEMIEKVKQWSSLDWRLYQHFNSSFWKRIDTSLGRAKLQQELELLRARRVVLEKTCLLGGKAVDPGEVHDLSLKPFQYGQAIIQGYNIRPGLDNDTHRLCQSLVTPELQYTRALYGKQFPGLAAKMSTVQNTPKHIITAKKNSSMSDATKSVLAPQSRTDSFRDTSNSQSNNVQAADTPTLSKDNI
ncbi:galactose-3-O-sulfotransferase 2-like [Silurus meridionalis]|nr:galactose-3-O-sulfotransferase 2-like [Silurus meridionalis]